MQEIIERILEGNVDYENGFLDFSCAKIELTLLQGSSYEGSFVINAAPGRVTNGYVVSSDLRMECLTPEFSGSSAEIAYCFHGDALEADEVVKGAFCVISNQGEYLLPFEVVLADSVMESSVGSIRNLFHFANLAKSNWNEAVDLFYSPEFEKILVGNDAGYLDCYRGLAAYPGNEQNVEEFLICVNKKQKVEYLIREESLTLSFSVLDSPDAVTEQEIGIVRNGWGYTALHVECEGDFLFTEKEFLGDGDFTGNVCRLPVFIDTGLCRVGKNYGRIFLFNSYISLTIPVEVRIGDNSALQKIRLSRKRLVVQLMQAYEHFRLKKSNTAVWLKETKRLVERLVAMDEDDIAARLFQAQVLITEERYNEAGWILDHAGRLIEESRENVDVECAYHWYLTSLVHTEDSHVREAAAKVEAFHRRNKDEWRFAWLLLYLPAEHNKSAAGKWDFLEKQAGRGCVSPVIYIEALALLNANPMLLRRLGDYELRLLYYGMKKECLNSEVVEQVLYLCGKRKEYSLLLLKLLQELYGRREEVRILQEICSMLIKGGRTDRACLAWYQKGVDAQLRITNLYEYYMMSVDLDVMQPIPKIVLMYFAYQPNLDYEHSAYLYHYLLEKREEFPELYENYSIRIERFVFDQIQKEHINRHLAALYRELLTSAMITEQTAAPLAKIFYANLLRVEDARLKKVLVYQPGKITPREYSLQDKCTWIVLYGHDNTILFEDAYGNRFVQSAAYSLERLMKAGEHLPKVANFVWNDSGFNLYLLERSRRASGTESEELTRYRQMADCEDVRMEIRRDCIMRVLKYYYDGDDIRALDDYLESIQPEQLTMEERGTVVRYLVLRGKTRKAYEWICMYAPYFVQPKVLMRLLNDMVGMVTGKPDAVEDIAEDEVLTAAAVWAFRKGKYDSCILRYLIRYYRGLTRELRNIWKAAGSFDLDCYKLCETMIVQMLYTGAFVPEKMEIFRYYKSKGSKPKIEEAFLAQCAYGYFVKQKITEAEVFYAIRKFYRENGDIQKVCKLAYLKYYAENPSDMQEEDKPVAVIFLKEMLSEKIHLNFFKEYRHLYDLAGELDDKTIIEYQTRPGGRAKIHYVIVCENGESEEYAYDYMRDVYGGICFKEFVLFFGENLQYYIMEENDGEEQLTESGSVQKSDISGGTGVGRFELINDMIISKTLQDYDTLDDLLEEYYFKEYMNGELFKLC